MNIDAKRAAAFEREAQYAVEHFRLAGLNRDSVFALLDRYYQVYDAMGAISLPSETGPVPTACMKGCAFCCHTIVVVTAPEAFYLAEFIEGAGDQGQFRDARARVEAFDGKSRGVPGEVRWGKGLPCPLLSANNGACSIYRGRPLACRGLFSNSLSSCKSAFERRGADPWTAGMRPFLFQNSDIFTRALAVGLRSVGLRLFRLELNAALTEIWSVERPMQRWLSGEDIFLSARAPNASAPIA
jgi:Fe-S-cluster containining protein